MTNTAQHDLVSSDGKGLRCEAGDFWIDPWKPVPTAVVTHAHADHATYGCGRYIATPATADLLRVRLRPSVNVQELPFGDTLTLGRTSISLHPAGHVLGSAQVRVESDDSTWVISGDYTPTPGKAAEHFEAVPCDAFITESTFGLPIFSWQDDARVFADLNAWWKTNAANGRTSVVYAYSLGKAQRVLTGLDPSIGPIGVHGSVVAINDVYRRHGIPLPETVKADKDSAPSLKGTGLIVAPPSASQPAWLRRFQGPEGIRRSMASGWMTIRGRRRWRALDRGFILSDHADWHGLLSTIEATGATRIGVTHGYTAAFSKYLREERSLDAYEVSTRFLGEEGGVSETSRDEDQP